MPQSTNHPNLDDEEILKVLLETSRTPEGRAQLAPILPSLLSSPPHLLRLRLLRNLCAGDQVNQDSFLRLSGAGVILSSSSSPEILRAGLQVLGNVALAGEAHKEEVWARLFPGRFLELCRVRDKGVVDPLCMVIDTCCSGGGGGGGKRLEELVNDKTDGLRVLVEIVTTASQAGYEEEWLEWLLVKVCVEVQKFASLFAALDSSSNVEAVNNGDFTFFNNKHAFLVGVLSKCLSERPKEVMVSNVFALDIFKVMRHASEVVDFTSRGNSALPTGHPAIDVMGYSLVILRDICAWEHPASHGIEAPVALLLNAGLLRLLLSFLRELEPPTIIRKSMAKAEASNTSSSKVCPYKGYRREIVSVISNCLHQRKAVQDEVREQNAILILLQQCVLDEENPFLREWGLLAVKNLLEGNMENQKEVAELELQESVITPEIADLGLRVEVDQETRRAKLVNMS